MKVVAVTKKGQATIPKEMRKKYNVGDKVLVVDAGGGILLKPIPNPSGERGSLKGLLKKNARETLAEARSEEIRRDRELLERSLRH